MDKKTVSEALRALACNDQKRSIAARLRDVADDVEAALQAGVTRSAVVEELARHGLVMTLPTFETTLRRIRQQHQRRAVAVEPAARPSAKPPKPRDAVAPTPSPVDAAPLAPAPATFHNPTDLDRIMNCTPDLDALARLAKRNKGA